MSDFHPEWLTDLGPWHAVGDTPFLARCLPSDPDGAILILRPWGPWEEQRWRAVFSPPDRDDDGRDWRHGEILTPDGRYWPDRESAEAALDAAWSAWRARYRASRGVAPDDGRRHNLLVALTPSLLARIEALGFEVGSEGVLPWLVGKAEEMRAECDAFATYREAATTALGIEPSSCAEDVAEAVNEMRLTLAAEQGRQKECLNMLDHLIAHVEDHGEDAASGFSIRGSAAAARRHARRRQGHGDHMSDTSHDILDLLPEPHRTLAKQRRADAAREAQTPNSDIPRHLRIALASASRAFQSGDLSTLGTANEDLQPLIDAAIAWGRRQAAPAPALPFEVQALARFYTTDTTQEFWRCLACGGEWPCDIVTACANCRGPKE